MENELAEKYFPLCYKLSLQFNVDVDIAMLGLAKAIKTYNGKTKFISFAYRVIRNECLMFKRANKKHNNSTSLEYLIENDVVDVLYLPSNDNIEKEIVKQETINEVNKIMQKVLTPRQMYLIKLRFKDDLSMQEIIDLTGMKQPSISKCINNGLEKIRKELKNESKRFIKNEQK